jgi:hypothetical protein
MNEDEFEFEFMVWYYVFGWICWEFSASFCLVVWLPAWDWNCIIVIVVWKYRYETERKFDSPGVH